MSHESVEVIPSKLSEGVTYTVRRMSFNRRLDLMKRVRAIAPKLECFEAGSSQQDRIHAQLLSAEIDQLYVEWGLAEVNGLEIDGSPATPRSLCDAGPEKLFLEALQGVKRACHLSEAETKN